MRASEFIIERKKRSKKTRGLGGYFFPGYGFYGGDAGEGGGDGGGGDGGGGGESKQGILEAMAADQVLDYVKRAHAPEAFDIEYSITDHPEWELKNIPLSQLNLDPDGEEPDPYNRVNWVDDDKVQELIPQIEAILKRMPIVVDSQGWIIDGNHRAVAAVEAGLTSVPALVPATINENFADGKVKGKSRPGRVKRSGASCDGSVTDLRARAKKASGERAKMYHWCANMKSGRKKTNEVTVGVLTLGEFTMNIDDHALDRAQERRIKSTDIDTVLKKIKLPRVIKKIMAIDLGSRFYVLDHSSNVALGFRRIGDKKLVLKTVYPGRPMDHNIATIITI